MNNEPLPQIHLIRDTDLITFAYELHIFAGDFLRESEFNLHSLVTNTGADSIAIMGKNHMWLSDALHAYCSTADLHQMIFTTEYIGARAFLFHTYRKEDGRLYGDVMMLDLDTLRQDVKRNILSPYGVDVYRPNGRMETVSLEKWHSMHYNPFAYIFKTFVATYLLTNCFTIVMAVFDVAQSVVSQSAGVINGNLDVTAALADLETQLEAMGMWELIGLWLETNIINLCMWVLSIVIFVIVYGRMIEIYLTVSLAPIPFSTMANREWGQMGTNYLRSLFALGFQGFLILVCVAIYAVLVQSIPSSGDIHGAIWGTAGYTVLLAFALFKTGSLSKSIFNSH